MSLLPYYMAIQKSGAVPIDERFIITITVPSNYTFTLPASDINNDFIVDWGDVSSQHITTANPSHTYTNAGTYTISVTGVMKKIIFDGYTTGNSKIISVDNIGNTGLTQFMFYNCTNLVSVVDNNFTGELITTMIYAFRLAINLTTLNLPNFIGTNVTSLQETFTDCGLTILNLPKFNSTALTNFSSTFLQSTFSRSKIKEVYFDSFVGSSVTTMASMFGTASAGTSRCDLEVLYMPLFTGESLTSLRTAFRGCDKLTTISLPSFIGDYVTDMWAMAFECPLLTSFSVPNFTGLRLQDGAYAFYNSTLTTESYSTLLQQMATSSHNNSVVFNAGNSKYNDAGQTARNILINNYGWTITDGGHI